jgi:hypothetical protein
MEIHQKLHNLEQIITSLSKEINSIKKSIPLSDTDKYNINRTLSLCKEKGWEEIKLYDNQLEINYYTFKKYDRNIGLKLYLNYNLTYNIFPGLLGTEFLGFGYKLEDTLIKRNEILNNSKKLIDDLDENIWKNHNICMPWSSKYFNPIHKSINKINLQLILFDMLNETNNNIENTMTYGEKENKAIENYSLFFGMPLSQVNLELVENSSAGIDGWYEYKHNTLNLSDSINLTKLIENKNNIYSGYYNKKYKIDIKYLKENKTEWRYNCKLIGHDKLKQKLHVIHDGKHKTFTIKNIKQLLNLQNTTEGDVDLMLSKMAITEKKRKV